MKKLSIDQVELKGKRVFIRVDFNVPLDDGKVTDDTRIKSAIPTIKHAISKGAKVIVASHLGRPKGERNPDFSLKIVLDAFSKALGAKVAFVDDCAGDKVRSMVDSMEEGDVLLLENLRFCKEEKDNDKAFAKKLADNVDVYVNDAFGAAHRSHASITGIPKFVQPAVAGFLLKDEIDYFDKSMVNPKRPLAVVLGGAKISTKLGIVEKLVDKCDILIIGGAMSFSFLKALGFDTGPNMVDEDMIGKIMEVMAKSRKKGLKLYLPVDFVVAESFDDDAKVWQVTRQELPKDKKAGDIGPSSSILFKEALKPAKTIVWNGPMGVFEKKPFFSGTLAVMEAMAESDALTIAGGGDSAAALNKAGLADRIDFISTGGGAFLKLMEGDTLPGIAALTDA